jgi:hypothetical protein
MHEHVVAFDIAKKRDFFAGMVFRRTPSFIKDPDGKIREVEYMDLIHIEQHGNLPYQGMAEIVENVMHHPSIDRNADLIVDGTGVGEAAIELISARGLSPISIISTGGNAANIIQPPAGTLFSTPSSTLIRPTVGWTVPKKDLVAAGQIALQHGRLRVAPGLPWADDFKAQLEGFKGRFNEKTMNTKYQAETEDLHDDLVVCFLMGAWWIARNPKESAPVDVPARLESVPQDWDPIAL